ncbi:winged helix-turn-helix domain-containing protein [Amycolatopsis cynarae]|uniref:Winged helix-turn-helix domain-containing protein n=1 Tax=Amycolatopsis cynarae TaxID=2995223 RepID=A0ABY7B715_9PSEU|nr:winged helix-turn-helix domain-containing protein [Amycolatopsis sp. HUAS 11-8]WAL64455.1 winged helix-turn-helix domain-containing protein [Amycolatopsis sp. HUAS 11-8]WAL67224.1 winged helix-turn-helix domain-containing protein [Amycolatopsis sp. HUAS 11-8]
MTKVAAFEPDPDSPVYVYAQVAEHVAARIAAGELPPGARLPNERDMAAEYGVSVATVRRAVAELRDRGVVQTVPVKGTFVTKR